jgi:hypothetical protein
MSTVSEEGGTHLFVYLLEWCIHKPVEWLYVHILMYTPQVFKTDQTIVSYL